MVFLDFIEDNKGIVFFIGSVFLVLILVSFNIFLPLPLAIKIVLGWAVNIIISLSFAYLIFWGIRSMWEMPELELWEWILVIGLLGGFISLFLMLTFKVTSFSVIDLVSTGLGMK